MVVPDFGMVDQATPDGREWKALEVPSDDLYISIALFFRKGGLSDLTILWEPAFLLDQVADDYKAFRQSTDLVHRVSG